MGGIKGVVVAHPPLKSDEFIVRSSMFKYPSNVTRLDVLNYSR